MTLYLYSIFIVFNLIFAFKKKPSKVLTISTLIFIFLLMSGAGPGYESFNHSRDYINYQIAYERADSINVFESPQVGYIFLMKLGNLLHLDFFIFRLIIIALCLFIIYQFLLKRYDINYSYVLLLYMLFPMIIDSEHFRNFIALIILILAIKFLENNSIKNKLMFLVLILIASSIHTAFILYSVLLLVNTNNKNRLIKGIAAVTIVLCIITFMNSNEIPFLNIFLSCIDDEKAIYYLTSRTNYGFLIPISLSIMNFLIISWAKRTVTVTVNNKRFISNNNISLTNDEKVRELKFVNMIYWINLISFVFFPLYMMSVTFYRMSKNILILNFIAYSMASSKFNKGSTTKYLFNFIVIISILVWLIMNLIIMTSPERVLVPFFTQNFFFN